MREGWKYIKFEDGLETVPKTTKISSSNFLISGTYPIISQEEAFINGYWNNAKDVLHINHPIVVFGDHTRILKYIDFDFVIGADGVKVLSPIKSILPKCLYYYLKWCKIPSLGYSRHYKLLKELSIPIPPIEEQQRIVTELDLLSSIIEKQKAQLKELDTLAQSIFYDMFGDPVTNEKGWKTELMCIIAPSSEYRGEHTDIDGKYWLLNLDKVESMTGRVTEKEYFDYKDIGSSTISFDTTNVLYSKLRPYLNKVVLPNETGYATSELIPLKPNKELLDRCYFANMLRSNEFMTFIKDKVAGAKMPRVSMSDFKKFLVPLPPLSLQQQFADKIQSIESQKSAITKSIAETQKLFDYTMDKYFG